MSGEQDAIPLPESVHLSNTLPVNAAAPNGANRTSPFRQYFLALPSPSIFEQTVSDGHHHTTFFRQQSACSDYLSFLRQRQSQVVQTHAPALDDALVLQQRQHQQHPQHPQFATHGIAATPVINGGEENHAPFDGTNLFLRGDTCRSSHDVAMSPTLEWSETLQTSPAVETSSGNAKEDAVGAAAAAAAVLATSKLATKQSPQKHDVAIGIQRGFPATKTSGRGKSKVRNRKTGKKSDTIKRPMNAFMLWSSKYDNRKRIAEENQGLANKDISRLLGSEWRELGELGRKRFKDEAEELKKVASANGQINQLKPETRAKKLLLPMARKLWCRDLLQMNPKEIDFDALATEVASQMETEDLQKAAKVLKSSKKEIKLE